MNNRNQFNDKEKLNHFTSKKCNTFSRTITALFFIMAGLILIAQRLGYISNDLYHMLFNWQMLIIAIGIVSITKRGGSLGGMIMILVGVVFLVPEYFNMPVNTKQLLWPAILIGVGLIILFKGFGNWHKKIESKFSVKSEDFKKKAIDNLSHNLF